jgi:flagellar hook-length control protein FliK
MPMPHANAAGPDALAAALARQPAMLRLPVADDSEPSALTVLTETLGLERAPDAAPLAPTSPTPALHKLDLAAAFPAPVPLPSPRFAEEVGARLQWIAEQQGGEATLRISPDGLGPVEIRLKLDGDRVELGFTATQQDTRQALQDALPKLREMLAQQGLQLGHADVGQKHAQSSNDDASKSAKGFAGDDEGDGIVLAAPTRGLDVIAGRSGRGILDLYA